MVDIFIIVVLVWALFSGWRTGFVKEVVSTLGALVGLLVAASCYGAFGKYLAVDGTETNMVTSIIAFFLLWIIVPIALGFVANIITKSIREMKLGMPNSMLGAAVSAVKYFAILSCVLNVMQSLHILNQEKAADSKLLPAVTGALSACFGNEASAGQESVDSDGALKADTVWVDLSKKDSLKQVKK